MRWPDVLSLALQQLVANKLRSFFTLLGVIVSVTFLVAVVAIIQGMNAYVKNNVAGAVIGTNAFQVRRTPLSLLPYNDDETQRINRRPKISLDEAEAVREALPMAAAVAAQSGYPTPQADLVWRDRTLGSVLVFGVTAPYQVVQDYVFDGGRPLSDLDVLERRAVGVVGADITKKLFDGVDPVGKEIRVAGERITIVGTIAPKGRVLGQSFDGFLLLPITRFEMLYGRRLTTTISVKMPDGGDIDDAIARAQEAMRVSRGLRPGVPDDFAIDKAEALVAFWKSLTRVLFSVIPAVVAIGIVVGGIVIMNIMLMSVNERTREIGLRKSVGATRGDIRRQFLVETMVLTSVGALTGVGAGSTFAWLIGEVTPLPATISWWAVGLAIALGGVTGVAFGVYPAARAARLDPITALRAE
ncbi:MAG: ABC transporter permease [Gemmatimonadota bacterium]|jgi:putative ABC transport system permease protein|nr:ABC transporter permease [Gemmatimonadota bacterium]